MPVKLVKIINFRITFLVALLSANIVTCSRMPGERDQTRSLSTAVLPVSVIADQMPPATDSPPCTAGRSDYPFAGTETTQPLRCRFATPPGYMRVEPSSDFAAWLRDLPLKKPTAPVLVFGGREATLAERLMTYSAGVIDMDLLNENQQCADAVIRLRAEYLWAAGRFADIVFRQARMTIAYRDWDAAIDKSRAKFVKYLKYVFAFIGTAGLKDELREINKSEVTAGDLHVQNDTGGIGHTLMILDQARNEAGRSLYLLGQGSIPALDFHVVRLPQRSSAWTDLDAIERHYSSFGESVYRRFE